jgi:hypothetical protein
MIVVDIGWQKIILPREDALKLVEILEKAEVYENKYWSRDERTSRGMTEEYTYHVYPNDKTFSMNIVSDQ